MRGGRKDNEMSVPDSEKGKADMKKIGGEG